MVMLVIGIVARFSAKELVIDASAHLDKIITTTSKDYYQSTEDHNPNLIEFA